MLSCFHTIVVNLHNSYFSLNCEQSHGFEHLATFFSLKKLGMLVEQEQTSKVAAVKLRRSQFRQLANKLGLVSVADGVQFNTQ